MFTVIPNSRNSNLYLIGALAIMIAVLLTMGKISPLSHASVPSVKPVSWLGSPAYLEYRRGEWSPFVGNSSIGSAAFYQYRLGEIAQMTHLDAQYEFRLGEIAQRVQPIDALDEFRRGERAQYAQVTASSVGTDAFYQYRRGEWFGN